MNIIHGLSQKNKVFVASVEIVLWLVCILSMVWLWDRWMLEGPHGPYRWVGMDFAPFWVGVREMFHGANPYGPETTLKIQQVVYGGPALGEDPMMFVYPAWLFLIIAPFSLLPYQWAAILYIGILLWAMLNFLYQLALALGRKNFLAQSLWLVWILLGGLPFLVISVTKGQLGYLSLLALFGAHSLWKKRPVMAGMILGLALIKPTVTVIPVAVFLLWVLLEKNWKFLAGFAGLMAVLLSASLLAVGNWFPGYFGMLGIKGGMSAFWSLEILPTPWNILYAVLFIGLGAFSFYSSRKRKNTGWFSAAVLMGIALTPMRWMYDLFLGILVLTEKKEYSLSQTVAAAIAVLSPWVLIFFPEADRWNAAVIGIPLIWALTWFVLFTNNEVNTLES